MVGAGVGCKQFRAGVIYVRDWLVHWRLAVLEYELIMVALGAACLGCVLFVRVGVAPRSLSV